MATNKTAITSRTIHVWLASLGFIFPTSLEEVARFERLYADMVIPEDELLDPEVILGNKKRKPSASSGKVVNNSFDNLKMAARNGKGGIPSHIMDKMKKNHRKPNEDNDGSEEKKPD